MPKMFFYHLISIPKGRRRYWDKKTRDHVMFAEYTYIERQHPITKVSLPDTHEAWVPDIGSLEAGWRYRGELNADEFKHVVGWDDLTRTPAWLICE